MAFNWSGMVGEAAVGIVTVPLLIHRLGDTGYGLWIVIGALAGYFQFLDFGMRGAIGRFVAFYQARDDHDGISRTLSTALAMSCGAGLLAFAGGLGLTACFPLLVDVPDESLLDVRWALLIVSLNLGLFFVSRAFDAVLWGFQRFDLLNLVDIPTSLIRLGLTFALVHHQGGLVSLAWITLLTTVGNGLCKAVLTFRLPSRLLLRVNLIDRANARELLGFGLWQFVTSIANLSKVSLIPAAIAMTLGVGLVVPFSIASRLVTIAGRFMIAATGVLSPLATALHAQENTTRQRRLFLEATRYCCCLAGFFVTGMLLFGRNTIELWVGPDYGIASRYLAILAIGAALPMAAHVSECVLIGVAQPRLLAFVSVSEAIFAVAAAFALGRTGDLTAVCVAIGVSATVFQG
ncbi:MAG: oligosaccharide flippase family protein, partial [Betaproteobacteria bacterium]